MISVTATMLLALSFYVSESISISAQNVTPYDSFSAYHGEKLPELEYYDHYEELHPDSKVVVIYPIFTQSAFQWGGFHDFYEGYCDSCLSVEIDDYYKKSYSSSGNGFRILEFLGYDILDDIDVDKNPKLLEKYDKIILLHNEFVTQSIFDSITHHPNVVYLYPNALSSKIEVDYSSNTISLIRGPGFPSHNTTNGFDWDGDNSEYFEDWDCNNWQFYPAENGHMLNCYPETHLPLYGYDILKSLKDL